MSSPIAIERGSTLSETSTTCPKTWTSLALTTRNGAYNTSERLDSSQENHSSGPKRLYVMLATVSREYSFAAPRPKQMLPMEIG